MAKTSLANLAHEMYRQAVRGLWDGKSATPYFAHCRRVDPERGISLLYSRDTGHHSGGWWKNPDYERCFHLALSFFDPESLEPRPRDIPLTRELVRLFFGWNRRWLWCEPPYSADGKRLGVWHYRLFCDGGWRPIKPRGEVYSRELIEAGWKSFSDVQAEMEAEQKLLAEMVGNQLGI